MDSPTPSNPAKAGFADRRSGKDRRKPSRFPPEFSAWRRRRSSGRRKTDRPHYVDIYDPSSWAIAIAILSLSFLDAFLTAFHVNANSAREANPIMAKTLELGGIYAFVSVKSAMTAFPLAIIMLHKEWNMARFAARVVLIAYVLIALYHLFLLYVTLP